MNRVSANFRVHYCLYQGRTDKIYDIDEDFVHNVLVLFPDSPNLEKVGALRKSELKVETIPRLRLEGVYSPTWVFRDLHEMQLSTRPVAGSDFCHTALAMAMDFGVDVEKLVGDRVLAILMAAHRRLGADSLLSLVGDDCLKQVSLYLRS